MSQRGSRAISFTAFPRRISDQFPILIRRLKVSDSRRFVRKSLQTSSKSRSTYGRNSLRKSSIWATSTERPKTSSR